MLPGQIESEHAGLLSHANALLADLAGFAGKIDSGDVSYDQHRRYAMRAATLSNQLTAGLALASAERYGPAFCLLRPSLEQLVLDRLLCLASRYRDTFPDISLPDFEQWKQEWKAGSEKMQNILRMERDERGTVHVELKGLTSADPSAAGQTLSVYLFLLEEYQPFVAPPKEQAQLLPDFDRDERQKKFVIRQHEMYHTSLRWPALISNLRLNNLASAEDILRISVHYRFLSAFVHPLKDHHRLLYGKDHDFDRALHYDHYSSELYLLYAIAFAAFELETLIRASQRPPSFATADLATLSARIAQARDDSSYLWFLGDEPQMYDRIREANKRYWALRGAEDRTLDDPRRFAATEVRYYQDPLCRLINLHQSINEMMGYSFASPWPRSDAALR